MSQDVREVLIAVQAKVYFADAEATLPTGLAAPSGSYVEAGYTTPDGLQVSFEATNEEIFAHQDRDPLLLINTARSFQVTFNQMQWNEDTFPLGFGGGTFSTQGGVREFEPLGSGEDVPNYTFIFDVEQGEKFKRFFIRRGAVASGVESSLVNNAAAVMPITAKALKSDVGKSWGYRYDDGLGS